MVSRKAGRPSKDYQIAEGEYQTSARETLDGKDYIQFMGDVLQARNDPVWFIEEILGFPGIDEQGNQRHMWPMQDKIIREFYQNKYDPSLPKIKKMDLVMGQRCALGWTLIRTSNGILTLEQLYNLKINNCVLPKVYNGSEYVDIDDVFKLDDKKQKVIITTVYGFKFECSKEHKLYTFDGESFKWKLASELTPDDYIELYRGYYNDFGSDILPIELLKRFKNENKSKHTLPIKITKNIAMLMGMLIADGSINNKGDIGFTKGDIDIVNNYKDVFKFEFNLNLVHNNKSNCNSYQVDIYNEEVRNFLFCLGLTYSISSTKEVPYSILNGTFDLKCAFLSGYFSCDGSVYSAKSGNYTKCRLTVTTVSEKLAYQIQNMLLEVGILSSISIGKSVEFNSRIKRDNNTYSINIFGQEIINFYRIISLISSKKQESLENCCNEISSKKINRKRVPLSSKILKQYFKYDNSINMVWYNRSKTIEIDNCLRFYKGGSDIIDRLSNTDRIYANVKSVEITDEYEQMYDLSVPDGNCYVANGMLSHNSGKTTITGTIMAYELFETISWENPAQHYGLMVGKSGKGSLISHTCVAVNRDQAKDGIFSNMRSLLEGNEWFEQWFDFTCKEQRIEFPKKNVIAQVLASKASNAAGRTNRFVGFDELDLFQDSETLIDATSVYEKLCNSTDTFGLDGKILAISSLQYPNGIMMKVYRDGLAEQERGLTKAYMYKTWEVNPNVTEDYLRSICANDMTRFYRDFANMPEVSGGVQFPEGVRLDKNIPNVLQMDFKNLPFNVARMPHVMSIDPAFKNDAFGIACAYRTEDEIVVDGVFRFENSGKGDIGYVKPSDMRKFIIDAVKAINVTAFIYDVHIFPELIESIQYDLGLDPIQHIVGKEDYDRWRELQEGKSPTKLRVVHDLVLRKECEELIIKSTPGGKPKVDHPWRGSRDTSDTVANCIWYLEAMDSSEFERFTPIGNAFIL